jgi:hypothetical protein
MDSFTARIGGDFLYEPIFGEESAWENVLLLSYFQSSPSH